MNRRFVIDKIAWSLETLLAETTRIVLSRLVNVFYMLFQCVEVGRTFPAITASVLELLRSMVFDMSIVRLEISQKMPANFATHPIFGAPCVSLHVLFDSVFGAECLGADLTDFNVVG